MTIADAMERVAYIKSISGDAEAAHGQRDRLLFDALEAIGNGDAPNPCELAQYLSV